MAAPSMLLLASRVPRNAALLLTLTLLIVVAPNVTFERSWWILELLFDLTLLAGVYSVGPAGHRWPFLILTTVTLAVRWGELLSGVAGLDVTALGLTVVWLFYALSIIVGHLFREREVEVDTILGAVVAYLLAAVAFAMVYQVIELQAPGSFSGLPDNAVEDRAELGNSLIYFSFVCITTMGFGDIVPATNLTQPLAVMEGVVGQMYLGVMIARLVGLYITNQDSKGR